MTVLAKRETWRSAAALARRAVSADLTEAERANLRRALRFLRTRAGSGLKLARLLRVGRQTLDRATGTGAKGTASLSLRAARLAGVAVEDVLAGTWPPAGACAHCGRI